MISCFWDGSKPGAPTPCSLTFEVGLTFEVSRCHNLLPFQDHQLELVVQGNLVKESGYDDTFADGKLVTVFSCANYAEERVSNKGAVMRIHEDLTYIFCTHECIEEHQV